MDERSARLSATLGDQTIDYTIRFEQLPLRDVSGAAVGTLSAFSYIVEASPIERASRPVLFLTNGGPGAATSYLHLSGIAPFRADVPTDVEAAPAPPYGITTSESSILDIADLVFLDAPGTGFGSVDEGVELTDFHSVEADAAAVAAAITDWVITHERWNSPKYFLGESYGTHRAAFLATASHGFDTAPLDGILLLGQAVNIQEISERPGNVVGALANLPYKAAVARFHGLGSTEHSTTEEAIRAALDYAWGDLARVMLQGTKASEEDLRAMADKMSTMIGIPADELVRSRLWINKSDFRARLLRDRGLAIGSNDGRYTVAAPDASFGELPIDATNTQLTPRYTAAFHQLFAEVFGGAADQPYRVLDATAGRDWEWGDSAGARFMLMGKPSPFQTYPYPAHLSRWMKQSPKVRLFVGTGMYDSLTTIGAADHLLRQWELPSDRVTVRWYEGGHMMYSSPDTATSLNEDLRAFLTKKDSQ
ncbi:hypothetical protein QBL02_03790 [Leucobacter sp. UT-8R-CII-1-4]|uniref:S10 family serine carboxypeptidase-like protein n=1 Tax=Leucobacter sp. UT-8R-CII-1-4 TaxID=3040075 RepID=UPI0024A91652|nr:hypothetical protein [Leucobacter sp. UT-8R-CII-1-4]MDI6022662.1 hypothetical protein [Leucobacter sp. UT-8R-CII-1-4]